MEPTWANKDLPSRAPAPVASGWLQTCLRYHSWNLEALGWDMDSVWFTPQTVAILKGKWGSTIEFGVTYFRTNPFFAYVCFGVCQFPIASSEVAVRVLPTPHHFALDPPIGVSWAPYWPSLPEMPPSPKKNRRKMPEHPSHVPNVVHESCLHRHACRLEIPSLQVMSPNGGHTPTLVG